MEGNTSIVKLFFSWWYGEEAIYFLAYLKRVLVFLADQFSVITCLKTLLSPWKRDRISTEGLAIKDRFNVLMLNLTSRFVGFVIKLFTIAIFLVISVVYMLIALVLIAAYFIYPVIIIGLLYLGIKSILQI